MTDVNLEAADDDDSPTGCRSANGRQPSGPDKRFVAMVELLFFAYRDFTAEPDAVLAEIGFGRAHHRVLHFVNRNPGLRVADLLGVLRITKQSLSRVLKQLVDEGFVLQTAGPQDRRERRLNLTEKGSDLALRLLELQTQRICEALGDRGPDARRAAETFLFAIVSAADRDAVRKLIGAPL
jgi:DNA-binding MarR family transcriptional regulator